MTDNEKVVLAVAAGVAVGIAAGILLAPEKGSETRKKLIEFITDFSGILKDKFGKGIDSLANMREEAFASNGHNVAEPSTV